VHTHPYAKRELFAAKDDGINEKTDMLVRALRNTIGNYIAAL